jgi:hypothetical protein
VWRFIPPRLSRPRSSLPALKNGTVFSFTETVSPVRREPGDLVEYRHNDEFRIRYP